MTTETKSETKIPTFVIPPRTFVSINAPRGELTGVKSEEVCNFLERVEQHQRPEDIRMPLSLLRCAFEGGRFTAFRAGHQDKKYIFTQHGAALLSQLVLPAHGFRVLRALAEIDVMGERLATTNWGKFSQHIPKDPQRLVRTIFTKDPDTGKVEPCIRSVHSADYAPYSNLEYMRDIMAFAPQIGSMPVLSWALSDNILRVRFLAEAPTGATETVPVIEAWNSEVGSRRVILRGAIWKTATATLLPNLSPTAEFGWRHYGNPDRIRSGVAGAFEALKIAAARTAEAYKEALSIEIENALAWMESELAAMKAPDRVVLHAKQTFADPDVAQGSTLAHVVDAIGLAANLESDVELSSDVEAIASSVMTRGLQQAKGTGKINE